LIVDFLTVAVAIAGFGLLIFVHELGHFVAAKIFGIKVKEAFLGFGPKLVTKKRGETEYGIAALPLGGYVKLAGMEPEEPAEEDDNDRTFDSKSILKRIGVIFMGPLMNILIAIPIFALIFIIGVPTVTNRIDKVIPGSTAQKIGLKSGDRIIRVDDKSVEDWNGVISNIGSKGGKKVKLVIGRNGEKLTFNPIIGKKLAKVIINGKPTKRVRGFLGIQGSAETKRYPIIASIGKGFALTVEYTRTIVSLFASIFTGKIPFSTVAKGSAGPIGVGYILTKMARRGIIDYLWLLGIIGPNLAIINLFPFPPLDGGRVAFLIYEALRGKPVSKERMTQFQTVGITILLFLMAILLVTDASKILTGSFPLEGL
jgi:regulator of sigma E protease